MKIGLKTIDCIFIGYAHNSTAYQFLVHVLNIPDIHKITDDHFSCIFESLRSNSMMNYEIFTQIYVLQGFNAKETKTKKKSRKNG